MATLTAHDLSTASESETIAEAVFAPFRDAWIAARARFRLLSTLGSEVAEVNVEAWRANVILAGDVATSELREAAERVARGLAGVIGVSNRIRVRGEQSLRIGGSDAEIRVAVTARLRQARELRGSIVVVDSVYDGVVRLTGAARDADAATTAFTLAVDVPGVRRVINDVALQMDDPAGDADADAA